MANGTQATAKRMKMAERAQQQMEVHFPGISDVWLWHRKKNAGYITLPRTLPIVMQAIDMQTKGQPAGHTLFCLWARSPDHPVLIIENPTTFAAEAGFIGERAVDTWRRRMRKLQELKFIVPKAGASGEFHYILLLNPNAVMEWLRAEKKVQDNVYSRFIDRVADIGAHGEIAAVRNYWAVQQAAQAAAGQTPAEQAVASTGISQGDSAVKA